MYHFCVTRFMSAFPGKCFFRNLLGFFFFFYSHRKIPSDQDQKSLLSPFTWFHACKLDLFFFFRVCCFLLFFISNRINKKKEKWQTLPLGWNYILKNDFTHLLKLSGKPIKLNSISLLNATRPTTNQPICDFYLPL